MGNDIEIRVRVANNTASGLTAVNNSLRRLRDEAQDAGRGLDGLTARATAATVALRGLKDAAQDASRALRSLNQAARTTDTRLSNLSDRSRTLRRDTDDLDDSMRSLTTTMGGMRGSFGSLRVSGGNAGNSMNQLKKAALLLSPALIPIAAAAVPIAAGLGAAAVAVGAFGLAIGGQVAALAKASQAETKYKDAVKEHGRASEEAGKAENTYLKTVREMEPATRRAAASFSVFKDEYKAWTQSLSGDTMPVVTKTFATFGGLLPRLSPLIRTTSGELDRLMTVLAGGVNSSGFERLMKTFAEFAGGALSKATDGLVRFMRTMSGGAGSSQFSEFMAYVRDVGPQVGDTLSELAGALTHLVAAASDVGVGLLTLVNAFAQLVNAIPTDLLSTLVQFAVVFKLIKTAAAGLAGSAGGIAAFGASLTAMRAASVAAGGGLAGLAAAFGTLSKAAKLSVIAAGIGLVAVAVSKLAGLGKEAPPDVDRLTTALGKLGSSGRVGGEAARAFGEDLDGLYAKVRNITDPSFADQVQNGFVKIFTAGQVDSTASKQAQEALDAIDDSLVKLVKGGNADLAAAALDKLAASYGKGGKDASKFRGQMDEYKDALADLKFEQELAAQAMGLFGQEALAAQEKLNAQKQSADGLRQSIEALNDANRSALGGMIGFEASIDAAAKAAKENADSLDMVNGRLDVNSPKAQAAATALNDLATKTKDAALSARESGESWDYVSGIYDRGRDSLIKNAQAMGLNKTEAAQLADQILNIPDEYSTRVKMDKEDAERDLESFNAAVKRAPNSKSVTLTALSKAGEAVLESFGLKVKRLPDGSVSVSVKNGSALKGISNVDAALRRLDGKTATTWTYHNVKTTYVSSIVTGGKGSLHDALAGGGQVRGYAGGGDVQAGPDGLVRGPGSGTSDSILAMFASGAVGRVSNTEFVVNAASTKKYLPLLEAINSNQLPGFAKGGLTQAQKDARNDLSRSFGISHFGSMAGYQTDPFSKSLGKPQDLGSLVSALNGLRGQIKAAFSGGKESSLLKSLDSAGKKLIAYEKQLTSVNKSLEKARDKLDSLKDAAAALDASVKGGIISGANITRAATAEEGQVTINTLLSQARGDSAQADAFADALKQLEEKGVSGRIIEQIAEAGITGGGLETAQALLGADKGQISELNKLNQSIRQSADDAGELAADSLYGAGIKAAEGLVEGLKKKQDKIEEQMLKIAKSMEKAIKKALGIKSPSQVMMRVGDQTAEGFALGMVRNRSVRPAWESMLNVPRPGSVPRTTLPAQMGGGGGQTAVIQLQIGDTQLGEVIIDPVRKAVKTRGGLRATFGGLD